jgi:ribosomal protein L11 methyltransferase
VADRLAITKFAGAKTIRIEAFALSARQAERLRKMFGGEVCAQKNPAALTPTTRPPIRVRGKLVVVASEAERDLVNAGKGRAVPLLIPAGMAFGTGDHDTTATCLRFLADASEEFVPGSWEMLDLGCGTGILALAARLLGGKRVEAGDFDPDAVRTAKANVRANAVSRVQVRRLDVREWQPERTWDIVAANLFSGLLVEIAPKLAAAVADKGQLIFSGVLRDQEAEVVRALRRQQLQIGRIVRKGKWVTGLATWN